jgi:hypothetical protein
MTSPHRLLGRVYLSLMAALLSVHGAVAQTVTGRVTGKTDGAPVPGAIVALVDSSGRAVITALAEDDGTFRLTSPVSGRFTLRVERVGFRSTTSAPMQLTSGTTIDLPIGIAADGVSLGAVRVSADRRCIVRPQEGLAAAQLWDEARKALNSTQLTQMAQAAARSRRDPHRFFVRTRRVTRDLDPETLRARHEEQVEMEGETITPFVSAAPETLDRNGYIDGSMETATTYYAPDAAILLSDRFLDSHCFRVESGPRDREDLIGLAFEPIDLTRNGGKRAGRVDVSGVLWLDRASAELRYMEYHYVDLPIAVPNEAAGGQLEFRPLPDGRWIVWRWYIRAPRLERRQVRVDPAAASHLEGRTELVGIRENGAEVVEVMPSGSRQPQMAALVGNVSDSLRGTPLPGARVFLSGTSLAAISSADGSYAIEGIPPGRYSVSVLTSRFDSLLLEPPAHVLSLSAGEQQRLDFAIPSRRGISSRLCVDAAPTDTLALLLGVIRDTSAATAPGAAVQARWTEFTKPISDRVASRPVTVETTAGPGGRFALCHLPPGTQITVRARLGRNSAAVPVLHLDRGEIRRLDLQLRAP